MLLVKILELLFQASVVVARRRHRIGTTVCSAILSCRCFAQDWTGGRRVLLLLVEAVVGLHLE